MTIENMQTVVDRLKSRGVPADLEYPGFISLHLPTGGTVHFGDMNETWTGDVYEDLMSDPVTFIHSNILSSSEDIRPVVSWIASRLSPISCEYCGLTHQDVLTLAREQGIEEGFFGKPICCESVLESEVQ